MDHFITSLRDEVRILKELPPRLKRRVELGTVYSMPPISWSDISYYHYQVSFYTIVSLAFCQARTSEHCKMQNLNIPENDSIIAGLDIQSFNLIFSWELLDIFFLFCLI